MNEKIMVDEVVISINGEVTTPPLYKGETNFIIPDEIVTFCVNRYNLRNGSYTLDPMCGIGTIPRIINSLGGDCIGIEIDESRFNLASTMNLDNKVFHGDFMSADLPKRHFQCIFTSMPFDWFRHPNAVQSLYADKFNTLLEPNGFILLDSVPVVRRAGQEWPVASRQCAYLEAHGFARTETIRFISDSAGESVIMRFIKS